ncbi:MAG: MATE family efflux transporter [Pseudomonadota bacterium]
MARTEPTAGAPREARFTQGSTMRHVVVMTLTGSIGLTFAFLVDFVTLFWVGQIGEPILVAAIGFAWTIQFFTISTGIGLMIATVAMVSRAIGARDWARARRQCSAAMTLTIGLQTAIASVVFALRDPILGALGASGETLRIASDFLLVSLPSLPLMAAGMVAAAGLRATGDALRAMGVTMTAGFVALIVDPLLILDEVVLARGAIVLPIGFGFGVDGAAWGLVISRLAMSLVAFYWLIRVHDLVGPVSLMQIRSIARPFFRIAAPAMAAQMSTPMGNFFVTAFVAGFGDAAVAGWSVVSRLMILAFGGIFALSGAIGGIIGQNHGAARIDRVADAYLNALLFCAIYTFATWMALIALAPLVVEGFNLDPEGIAVVEAFSYVAAGAFVFTGALFVANAAFNNLGRPLWATGFNWLRDGVLTLPICWAMTMPFAAPGAVYGQALAGILAGALAALAGWRYIRLMTAKAPPRLSSGIQPAE